MIFYNENLVSVFMITYNHERFIGQAIESVLMQKTSFQAKLFIGEDCSTDETRTICLKYKGKNPDRIEVKQNKQNIGALNNAKQIYESCFSSGAKYIAMLEGDDYWIDPYKLQKQVDFLEAHPDYAMVYTDKKISINEDEIHYKEIISPYGYIIEDLLFSNFITTASVLVRTDIYKISIENIIYHTIDKNWQMLDYPGWLEIALNYKIGYISDITCAYRILSDSTSHSTNTLKRYLFDKNVVEIKEFFYKQYIKSGAKVSGKFRRHFKEMIFHLRKRMLLDFKWIAKEQILPLLSTNPLFYFYLISRKIARTIEKE
jgi:glycosyltransferase involved in cell wall biosynthesis